MNPGIWVLVFLFREVQTRKCSRSYARRSEILSIPFGGTILDKDGKPFNGIKEKQNLNDLIERMKKKGLIPGSGNALGMF